MENKLKIEPLKFNKHYNFFLILWTVCNILILLISIYIINTEYKKTIKNNRDSIINTFTSAYYSETVQKGLYAKSDSLHKPNHALNFYNSRDIITNTGNIYTVISPYTTVSYLFNDILEKTKTEMHISGFKPINQNNKPYDWEKKYLELMINNPEIKDEFFSQKKNRYYRFIKPLIAKESCIKCHQNAILNTVIGGISFTLPINYLNKHKVQLTKSFTIAIIVLWLIGLLIIRFSLKRLNKKREENRKVLAQLENNEEKFRMIVNNIQDVVWCVNTKMEFSYISPSIEKMTGYTVEEYMNLPYDKTHTPESYEKITGLFQQELQKLEQGKFDEIQKWYTLEEEIIHKNGNIINTEITATLTYDEKGNINGVQGVTRDITERKRYSEELQKSEKQLKELITTKDKFFSIIAHDLKNPFNSLLGFSNLLSENYDEYDDAKRIEFINLIENSAQYGFELLQNLLEWARTQTDSISFNPDNLNLNKEITDSIGLVKLNLESKKIEIVTKIDLILMVNADTYMLQTIMHNLLTNAIKFTNKGGRINISANAVNKHIEIKVKDTGIGIRKEDIEKLFRLDLNYTTKGTEGEKGTGLGLILCNEFIKKHGGNISVQSNANEGTEILFTLPKGKE